jgi:hypothetical protein
VPGAHGSRAGVSRPAMPLDATVPDALEALLAIAEGLDA